MRILTSFEIVDIHWIFFFFFHSLEIRLNIKIGKTAFLPCFRTGALQVSIFFFVVKNIYTNNTVEHTTYVYSAVCQRITRCIHEDPILTMSYTFTFRNFDLPARFRAHFLNLDKRILILAFSPICVAVCSLAHGFGNRIYMYTHTHI